MRQTRLSGARTVKRLICDVETVTGSGFQEPTAGVAYLDTALQQVATAGKEALWQHAAALLRAFANSTAFPSQDTIRSTAHTARTMA